MVRKCDVLIIGAGPAGLAAAIYAARAKMDTILLDKTNPGGQIVITAEIANYPGAPNDTGPKLIEKMIDQAKQFGAEILRDMVTAVRSEEHTSELQSRPRLVC